ncbi:hypothetical protein FOL47_003189 [Perkinsus chesapeaki]|uniref:Uncharacterized protein n=1 Tax=Perkinsus chesapeaki TaxID=330153 RepID=A0A7J6M998_PERCH|nr:hypothetical protein FOL47_003189 [Perkinsus chesapeaki]
MLSAPRYLLVVCLLPEVFGVNFLTAPGHQMCFHQDISSDSAIVAKYTKATYLMMEGVDEVDMQLECELRFVPRDVEGDDGTGTRNQPTIRALPKVEQSGQEAFSPKFGGQYDICVICLEEPGGRWKAQLAKNAKTKWSLTVDVLGEVEMMEMPFSSGDAATSENFKIT